MAEDTEPTSKIYDKNDLEKELFGETASEASSSPDSSEPEPIQEETQTEVTPLLAMQRLFALLLLNAGFFVVDKRQTKPPENGCPQPLTLMKRDTAGLMLKREIKRLFPQADPELVVKQFFEHPSTTCYEGTEFNPRGTTPGYLNLYHGPVVKPADGDCEGIKRFIFEVICDGDPIVYDYLVNFLAHMVQRPWEKPGVMVCLLGGQGTGKGTLAKLLSIIWGPSFLQAHKADSVTGSFNGSLERAFVVFLDEALFVGDRRDTNSLKSLITEPNLEINEKHQPKRQIESFHRFFLATNETHLKHTERDDRRDLSLRVSERYKGNYDYWNRLHKDIEANAGVFLTYLMGVDLSDFNVRQKPATEELLEKKLQSLKGVERWWFDCLESGVVGEWGQWPEFIATRQAIDVMMKTPGIRIYERPIAHKFVRALTDLCPSAKQEQRRQDGTRQRGLRLPSLEEARKAFEAWIGAEIEW